MSNDLVVDEPTIQESILNDSRISSVGNGNESQKPFCTQPTGGQKWWAAVVLGLLFMLVSSPVAYQISTMVANSTIGFKTIVGQGPTLSGLAIHTIVFILIIRIILW